MKNKKWYYIAGLVLCLMAVIFAAIALTHPNLSFPWSNTVSYILYALYGIYTLFIFLMPKFRNSGLASCIILAVQFIALGLIVISVGRHFTEGETNWYLPIGLLLTAGANFTNFALQKKEEKDKKQ